MATVLVVEPQRALCELIRANLQLDGHRVVLACDRESATRAIRQVAPEVMTLEVAMGGSDPIGLLAEIRLAAATICTPATTICTPAATICTPATTICTPAATASPADSRRDAPCPARIIVLTSTTDVLTRARCNLEGSLRYINKPFSMAKLRRAVAEVLCEPLAIQLRRAHTAALVDLGRLEAEAAGRSGQAGAPRSARPLLTRLELGAAQLGAPAPPRTPVLDRKLLSPRLNEMLDAALGAQSLPEAAGSLGVSCTYLYSSLRRAARRVGVKTGPELLRQIRAGELIDEGA